MCIVGISDELKEASAFNSLKSFSPWLAMAKQYDKFPEALNY